MKFLRSSRLVGIPKSLGLRPLALHASVAFVASVSASRGHFPFLFREDSGTLPDALLEKALVDPLLASFPSALDEVRRVAGVVTTFADKRQGAVSALIEGQLAEGVLERAHANVLDRARLQALRGTYASLWVVPQNAAIGFSPVFQSNAHLDVLLRYRLGVPLGPAHECPRCGGIDEGLGVHAMSCLTGGYRGHLHASMVSVFMALASTANWRPVPEPRVSATDGKRLDILFQFGSGTCPLGQVGVDFSCVNALADSHKAAAAANPSGAANEGSREKLRKYAALSREAGWRFVPLVVDSFGGWSDDARPLLARLSKVWGARIDMWERQAVPHVMGHVAARLAALVAKTLLSSYPADLAAARRVAESRIGPPPAPSYEGWKAAGQPRPPPSPEVEPSPTT